MNVWKKFADFLTGNSEKQAKVRSSFDSNQNQSDPMNDLSKILDENRIIIDVEADTKERTLKYLANLAQHLDGDVDAEAVYGKLLMRESQSSTVLGDGIVMPHIQDKSIDHLQMYVLKLAQPIVWDDQPSTEIVLALLSPKPEKHYEHVSYMSTIARLLLRKGFIVTLKSASTKEVIFKLFKK